MKQFCLFCMCFLSNSCDFEKAHIILHQPSLKYSVGLRITLDPSSPPSFAFPTLTLAICQLCTLVVSSAEWELRGILEII